MAKSFEFEGSSGLHRPVSYVQEVTGLRRCRFSCDVRTRREWLEGWLHYPAAGDRGKVRFYFIELTSSSSYLKVHPRPLADCSAIAFAVITRNVSIFSYSGPRALEAISVDGCEVTVGRHASTTYTFQLQDELWKCLPTDNGFESPIAPHSSLSLQALQSGPMIRFLAGRHAMSIVINLANPHHRSIAHRIQQAIFVYHRISSRIIDFNLAHDLLRNNNIGHGNVVSIGECLSVTGLKAPSRPKPIEACGWISLYPHPVAVGSSLAMVIGGTDVNHLELALRLFPLRTGVPVS